MSDTQAVLESLKEDVRALSDTVDVLAQASCQHTRQLLAVGKRLDRIDIRLDEYDQRFTHVDQRLDGIDQRLDRIGRGLDQIDTRLGGELHTIRGQLTEILDRLAS